MNETRRRLLHVSRRLFARRGYDGASIRAITRGARTNLGAVTYHFGSKEHLYHEVLRGVTQPLQQTIQQAAAEAGAPLDRIENILRAFFAHVAQEPDMPALLLRELALERPIPAPVRAALGGVYAAIGSCLAAGQRDGSIVSGEPVHLTLGVVSQPVYTALAQRPLRETIGLDVHEPDARARLVNDVVHFVRRGLQAPQGDAL
jgi:AcrR family transcriptional regulator